MIRLRACISGMMAALLFVASVGAQVTQFSERVFNEQVLRPSGQPVIPLYEGYYPNPDGTYEICFGYFNLNTEEDVDIPLGPNNVIAGFFSFDLASFLEIEAPEKRDVPEVSFT